MKITMPLVTLLCGAALGVAVLVVSTLSASPLASVSIKVQGTSIVQA